MDVVVNAAMSADGKLSTRNRVQIPISGPEDFDRVDRLRAAADAVVVGVGTVLADDPHLTVDVEDRRVERLRNGRPANPARVVVDSRARTPTDSRILDDAATTFVLVSEDAPESRTTELVEAGAQLVCAGESRVALAEAFSELEDAGIGRMMVEGGGELIFSLFEERLVDELSVFVGPTIVGGRDAPTLADGDGFTDPEEFATMTLTSVERLDDGVVLYYDV